MKHYIIKPFHFRVANGTVAAAITSDLKPLHPNTYHFSKEKITSRLMTYIMPKGSPLQVVKRTIQLCIIYTFESTTIPKGKFTNAIMWLKDTGILDKVKYDAMNPPIPKPDPTMRRNKALILRQLGIIMIILVVGLALGMIVFFVELNIKPKPMKTPAIELKEIPDTTRPPAASGLTPVIVV